MILKRDSREGFNSYGWEVPTQEAQVHTCSL